MRRATLVGIVLMAALSLAAAERRKVVDFEQDVVEKAPVGFAFGHTARAGSPGRWVVQQESGNKLLAQLDSDRTRARFPVAVLTDVVAADIDLSVRFKPVSGEVDQAAGLVWRYLDENNYYVVRANALEGNVVLYKVQAGKRTDLALANEGRTYGKAAKVPAGEWSTLRVVAAGRRFTVYFQGRKLYNVDDDTFKEAGKVGVWTKADSVTYFDDLTVVAL